MSEKKWSAVQPGDILPGETRGCWLRVTSATTNRHGRVDVQGVDIDTGETVSTWGMADTTTVVGRS